MSEAPMASLLERERWRLLKDRMFAAVMVIGGISVVAALLLIFFYLLYVVLPLFRSASLDVGPDYVVSTRPAAVVGFNEYADTGFQVAADGHYAFFDVADGRVRLEGDLGSARLGKVSAIAAGDPASHAVVAGTDRGRVIVAQLLFDVSFTGDQRVITPRLSYPLGRKSLKLTPGLRDAVRLVAGQAGEDEVTVAAVTAGGRVIVASARKETSMLGDETTWATTRAEIDLDGTQVTHLILDNRQRTLYLAGADGTLTSYDVTDKEKPALIDRASVIGDANKLTAMTLLPGHASLVIGDDRGHLNQWFLVRDAHNNRQLKRIRHFVSLDGPIAAIAPEHFRKGFVALTADGTLGLYHATADRQLLVHPTGVSTATASGLSPRAAAAMIASADGHLHVYALNNPHPEVSFSALWDKVWYENRQHPDYIWQSSSASNDFEPKFSLMPLTFGTFKAAAYSMLFAIPLAVLGAIYTAYFMSPALRAVVKPSIELMAALPTVILGFLAGLWLAPLIERELLGILLCVPVLPGAIIGFSLGWAHLPGPMRRRIADGWEAAALLPVLCLALWGCLAVGRFLEAQYFGGSVIHYMSTEYGIAYDQRNSLVVAIAIGFAVIPTIFTISEDAVFSVPRHLTMGSLALGATPWQTAIKVVLLTASPGIFSAIMIGMGRAVGETMIVLMATGNTPIMDLSLFQGLRALSANIAVEMPESELNSTHYRVLFLAAMVLFVVTFAVNTLAEVVRQRLRRKYGSL